MRTPMHFTRKFFIFVWLLPTSAYAINIEKLQLKNITITNKTNQTQTIDLYSEHACAHCPSTTIVKKNMSIPAQASSSADQKNSTIKKITLLTKKHSPAFLHLTQDKNYVMSIQEQKQSDFPLHKEFYKTLLGGTPNATSQSTQVRTNQRMRYIAEKITITKFLEPLNKLYQKYNLATLTRNKNHNHLQKILTRPQTFRTSQALKTSQTLKTLQAPETPQAPKIPLFIHQIWFGITGDMPHLYKQWQKKLKKMHPTWRFICWSSELLKKYFPSGLFNQKAFNQATNYAAMADIARYELIEKYGGLYLDCDTIVYEPFDVLHDTYDFFTSMEPPKNILVANCLFAAKPYHPFLQKCMLSIHEYEKKHSFKTCIGGRTIIACGPGMMSMALFHVILATEIGSDADQDKNIIFPHTYFCPNNAHSIQPETFSYHAFYDVPTKTKGKHWGNM